MQIKGKFGVDTGNIGVADLNWIKENGGQFGKTAKRMGKLIELEPGRYHVNVHIPDSWNGNVVEDGVIETNGKVAICDICYLFSSSEIDHDVWSKFLDKTGYLKYGFNKMFSVDTGGDGEFRTVVNFQKI